ncbi:MAG: undecaprenyl/decaprenyl-phosphate alpha-N-acetylglucosaminyl 1-phosphate transferase [Propionibacteriaceae bacterium]|nr:undecaprenyl/decaprenyl-phosphate alpha-N-acetylglucosaminyl 1-phosphate transferase [Propionibacteriaceae bacterium]
MREYLLVMLTAAATTYLVAGPWRRIAVRSGALAPVRDRDVHTHPMPYLGGMAMLCGVAAAFLLADAMPWLGEHATVTRDARGILLAGLVICLVGAVDDVIDLPVIAKVFGEVLAAGVAVQQGVRLYWVSLPNSIYLLDPITSTLITVVFIFICVNAVNLVDGLDGLSSGVVGMGASAMFCYTYFLAHGHQLVVATTASLVTATITGICLGFLPHNFHPARMFMGDSGSLLLGLLLACSTISFTGQMDSTLLQGTATGAGFLPAYLPLILPIAIMFIPLLDSVMAYVRRTLRGEWWFKPDKQHLHHRLLQLGHSQTKAVLLMYLWTAVISYGVMGIGLFRNRLIWIGVVVALLVAAVLTWAPWLRRNVSIEVPTTDDAAA